MEQHKVYYWTCQCGDRWVALPGDTLGPIIAVHQRFHHRGRPFMGHWGWTRVIANHAWTGDRTGREDRPDYLRLVRG